MSEFGCLERAINEMEDGYSSSQRCFDKIETLIENIPSLSSPRLSAMHGSQETLADNLPIDPSNGPIPSSISSPIFSVRGCYNPAPDGPVYGAFQRELGLLRGELASEDRRAADGSPPRPSTPSCTAQLPSAQLLQSQLDEARASNRMAQRALTTLQVMHAFRVQTHAVICLHPFMHAAHSFSSSAPSHRGINDWPDSCAPQRRLRAVELERDQLRVERDRFRSILSAAQRYPFQSQQAQLASLGLSPGPPPAGAGSVGAAGMRAPSSAPGQVARHVADGGL
jgi:hypothetical protein